jgi:hypothetical protein
MSDAAGSTFLLSEEGASAVGTVSAILAVATLLQ